MRMIAVLMAAGFIAAIPAIQAQENRAPGEPAVYKAEFVIHDGSNPAVKAGRRSTILIDGGSKGLFRSGDKIPYATGPSQYQYADIGVNIDCRVHEVNGRIALNASLDMSNLAPREKAPESAQAAGRGSQRRSDSADLAAGGESVAREFPRSFPPNPTISSTRFEISAIVNPGKPALVASIDDPVTARKLDVEVIVSRVN